MSPENEESPYRSPSAENVADSKNEMRKAIRSNMLLFAGLIALGYGAIAFWFYPSLPPYDGIDGRLSSLYLMGGGAFFALAGAGLKGLLSSKAHGTSAAPKKHEVPTVVGIVLMLGLLLAFFLAIEFL